MFTGIVLELGEVVSFKKSGDSAVLAVRAGEVAGEAAPGDSIAINGACLTVTSRKGGTLAFDLSGETLGSTTLGRLESGDRVNLEPSLRPDGKLGGHFVTGHVDAVGKILKMRKTGNMLTVEIQAPPVVMDLLVEKGSVAVDGISLTVVEVLRDSFTLVIIPHTAEKTTLGFKGKGDAVNLETDMLGKYVMKLLGSRGGRGDSGLMRALAEEGFLGTG
jgi:riboflavin synthase